MTTLVLKAPLAGWACALSEVPDPVFAEGTAGDGVAIDPTDGTLHAPCDGEIVAMKGARHAVTIRTPGGADILLHVGIDTVQLDGAGFEMLVAPGQAVRAGDPLLRFDLDQVALRAKSAVTPVLVAAGGTVRRSVTGRAVAVGDFLMEVEVTVAAPASTATASMATGTVEVRRLFGVPFEHGLHARPAALLAAALRPFEARVAIVAHGREGNARSTTALMALGVRCGDTIEVLATGAHANEALAALEKLLTPAAFVPAPAMRVAPAAADDPKRLEAVIACRGVAVGEAVQWTQPDIAVPEAGAGHDVESGRLSAALATVRAHLEALAAAAEGEQRAILEAHVGLVDDPGLAEDAAQGLRRGESAGHAWRAATRATVEALSALHDVRMRERAADLRDLENQVLRVLSGKGPASARVLPPNAIILADELLPSQLASLDRTKVAGIAMARGGATSHVAIIAASMGIPALVAAGPAVLAVREGTTLVLDAEHGRLDVDPAPEVRAAVERALANRAAEMQADRAAAREPAILKSGERIAVYANLGSLADARVALEMGAEGCGLLRTEFLFLDRREAPSEDEQARAYQAIAAALDGRPFTVRTLDIGGDKPIAYLPLPDEENPALGLRGVRTSLWRPDLLRAQLRAILRVVPSRQVRILLPMVTDVAEVRIVRALIDEGRDELGIEAMPALGVMVETPASAMLADQLAAEVDFLSIGTNDLSQYTLAMDRGHPELAGKLDALHPAVLRLIGTAAKAANAAGKEVAVCGSLGSDLSAIPILVGLGVHEVSAVPASIPRIKRTLRSLDEAACRELARKALALPTAEAVRNLMGE